MKNIFLFFKFAIDHIYTGGACGWGDDVQYPPFSSMISAGNANIFLHGKGCGDCYQV